VFKKRQAGKRTEGTVTSGTEPWANRPVSLLLGEQWLGRGERKGTRAKSGCRPVPGTGGTGLNLADGKSQTFQLGEKKGAHGGVGSVRGEDVASQNLRRRGKVGEGIKGGRQRDFHFQRHRVGRGWETWR